MATETSTRTEKSPGSSSLQAPQALSHTPTINGVRKPVVDGMFYPADAPQLRALVAQQLAAAKGISPPPKALIAPHAGYLYSGPVAASAFAQLLDVAHTIHRVILLGTSHWITVRGLAASSASAFATPLGAVPVDKETQSRILAYPQVQTLDKAHLEEHSIEVQLPFLQQILDHFSIVPLLVGNCDVEEIAEVLEVIWGGPETLVVVSTDLSHYRDGESARALDRQTAESIDRLAGEEIAAEQACCASGVRGLLRMAVKQRLKPTTLDVRNSGDTAGLRDRVVGYGAFAFA